MKKIFSFVAALVVAMVVMVSCGSVKSANDGLEAGKAYAKAFEAANGDLSAIQAAYDAVAKGGAAYAGDQIQNAMYLTGALQSAEEKSADCAGSFLAIYKLACTNAGVDAAAIETGINNLSEGLKNKAAVKAACDNFVAAFTTPAVEEVEEAEEAVEE